MFPSVRWDKLDKKILAKAIGITMMGWIALPIIYYLLKKREGENGKEKQEDNETLK